MKEIIPEKVITTISNLKTGEVYKTEDEWKAKGVPEAEIRRDVKVIMPSLDLFPKTKQCGKMAIIRSKIARQLLAEGGAPRKGFMFGSPGSPEQEASFGAQAAMDVDTYSGLDQESQAEVDQARFDAGIRSADFSNVQAPSFSENLGTVLKNLETDSRMNRIGRGILTTPGAIKSAFGFRDVSPELLQTLAEDYTRGGLYSEGLVGGDISLANAAKTFQGLEDLGVDLTKDIRSQVADISRSKFAERFGPKTKGGEGGDGDNEPIKKLRAPITEKKEEPKSEFDDILKFYGAKYARGGDVDYADLDLEEQAAVDRGEATAQMTTQERDEQGYGGGDADDLPTLAETGPIVYGGGPTRNVSGFGLLGRPTPTISKTTQDKITTDILTEEDDMPFGFNNTMKGTTGTKATTGLGFAFTPQAPIAIDKVYGSGLKDRTKMYEDVFKADGGDVRQEYGLGSIVKKATRAVKKVAKSPLGKAALAFGAYKLAGSPKIFGEDSFIGKLTADKAFKGILGASLAAGLFAKEDEEDEKLPTVANTDPEMTKFIDFYGGPRRFAEDGGDIEDAPMKTASMPSTFGELNQLSIDLFGRPYDQLNDSEQEILIEYFTKGKKQGIERATAAMGGMMEKDEMLDLGGKEMDLRGGGFVPLGEYEKKDDVPARLSKNEFVFTADAVRAAGGGSVDKGADVMYKTMKTLENKVA